MPVPQAAVSIFDGARRRRVLLSLFGVVLSGLVACTPAPSPTGSAATPVAVRTPTVPAAAPGAADVTLLSRIVFTDDGAPGFVGGLRFNADGVTAVTHSTTETVLWQLVGSDLRRAVLPGSAVYSPDLRVAAVVVSSELSVVLQSLNDGVRLHTLPLPAVPSRIFFSPDSTVLAVVITDDATNDLVQLWRVTDGSLLQAFRTPRIWNAVFSPDATLLALSSDVPFNVNPDGSLRNNADAPQFPLLLYRVADGSLLQTLTHDGLVAFVTFSPDSRTVATGTADGARDARLWSTADGSLQHALTPQHGNGATAGSFSRDGQLLVTLSGYDASAEVWRVAAGVLLQSVRLQDAVTSAALSADGRWLAVGTGQVLRDQPVQPSLSLWRTDDGTQVAELGGHGGALRFLAFSPDDAMLVSGAEDGVLQIWRVTR